MPRLAAAVALSAVLSAALLAHAAFQVPYHPDGPFGVHPAHIPPHLFGADATLPYDTAPMHDTTYPAPDSRVQPVDSVINNQLVHGWRLSLLNPAKHFQFMEPLNNCPGFERTSVTALSNGCLVATNAGFFDTRTGACLGTLIANGKVVQVSTHINAVFATTVNNTFAIGYVPQDLLESGGITNAISGVGWLVRDGKSFVDQAIAIEKPAFDFINEAAPRVAIGYDASGDLMIVQVDGDERLNKGLSLYEFAELLIQQGMYSAINIDGGGSATVYNAGSVVNQPSDFCPDGVSRCERFVTSITCFK